MTTNNYKNGLVAVAKFIEHACRTADRYGATLKAAIDAVAATGKITTSDAAAMKAAIDTIQAVCELYKKATS